MLAMERNSECVGPVCRSIRHPASAILSPDVDHWPADEQMTGKLETLGSRWCSEVTSAPRALHARASGSLADVPDYPGLVGVAVPFL